MLEFAHYLCYSFLSVSPLGRPKFFQGVPSSEYRSSQREAPGLIPSSGGVNSLPQLIAAEDLQKTQKKELESAAKALNQEAKSLEKSGKLVEARLKYAESLGYIEQKEASQAISRLDDTLKSDVKAAVAAAQKMYEAGRYKEAAQATRASLEP